MGALQSDIERVLKRSAPWIARELQNVFSDAMQETIRGDKPYYEAAGKWDEAAINQAAVNRIIPVSYTHLEVRRWSQVLWVHPGVCFNHSNI